MPFESAVGLNVVDQKSYAEYRRLMTPILRAHGGGFRYDFEIAATLTTDAPHPINRLFLIHFPDRAAKERFFANPDYVAVRSRWFEPAIQGRTVIAEYDR